MSVGSVPQWKPEDKQARFLQEKKKQYKTVTAYMRHLVNKEMKREKFE